MRQNWQSNYSSDQPADAHMQPLLDTFRILKKIFRDDKEAIAIIERETEWADWWISDHISEDTDDRSSRRLGSAQLVEFDIECSIFDDVDA